MTTASLNQVNCRFPGFDLPASETIKHGNILIGVLG
jgi:hypothetical protein